MGEKLRKNKALYGIVQILYKTFSKNFVLLETDKLSLRFNSENNVHFNFVLSGSSQNNNFSVPKNVHPNRNKFLIYYKKKRISGRKQEKPAVTTL